METSNFLNSKQKEIVQNFENLVKEVFEPNNQSPKCLKVELMNKVENVLAICKQNLLQEPEEAMFIEDAKDDSPKLPNELWMKILTCLPTSDIFASFALVNKHFHGLTFDPSAIKYIQIKAVDYHQVNRMTLALKRCKNLKELSIIKNIDDSNDNNNDFVMEAFQICNKLESVKMSINIYGYDVLDFRRAFNQLFENNHETLKRIDLKMIPWYCESDLNTRISLKSLSLCQKLEELSGTFHAHDIKWISKCQSLTKLELRMDGSELEEVFRKKLKMPNLKCLSINGIYLDKNIDYYKLSKQYLPALEKLYLTDEDGYVKKRARLDLAKMKKMVENFQNLVTIHIDEEPLPKVDVPNEYLYEIFKDFGILVIFGSVSYNKMSNIQKNFEDFLEHDPLTFEKYNQAKCSYAKWCDNNHWFGNSF